LFKTRIAEEGFSTRFTHKLFRMTLAVLLPAPALLAQNAVQVTDIEVAAAGGRPNFPTVQSSFGIADTAVYVDFTGRRWK
jgi:hypothetical protein